MQGTPPVEVAGSTDRRPARLLYIVVALAGLLLLGVTLGALLVPGRPAPSEPQPSSDVVELASSYERLYTVESQGGVLAWSSDGRRVASVSGNTVHFARLDGSDSGFDSVAIDNILGMLWSPDGRTLAVHSLAASTAPAELTPRAIIESPWPPNSGYAGPTLTLVDPDTASVRHSIVVAPPDDFLPGTRGEVGWHWLDTGFVLLGWAEGGRYLVTMHRLGAVQNLGEYGMPEFLTMVSYQVWDAQTGQLINSQPVITGESSPTEHTTLHDVALSPDGRSLAFVFRDEDPRPGTPYSPDLVLELWDVFGGQRKHSVSGLKAQYGLEPRSPWRKLEWSPDSATLYVVMENTVKVIDATKGSIVRQLPDVVPPTSTPTQVPTYAPPSIPTIQAQLSMVPVPVSTGGTVAATATPNVPTLPSLVELFRSFFPRPQPTPAPTITPDPNYYDPLLAMALSPDGQVLATYDLHVIRLWDTSTGKLKTFTRVPGQVGMYVPSGYPQTGPPPVVAWSPDGRLLSSLVLMGGSRVWLVDPGTGKQLRMLGGPATKMEWSPYTNSLAISPREGIVEILYAKDAATMQVTPGSSAP